MQFAPAVCASDEELLSSIQVMRDEAEQLGVKLVDRILSNAIINGNSSELATLHRECELDLEIEDNLDPCNGVEITTAWLFEFTKINIHSPSVKARITFFDRQGYLVAMNNLADYNPFLHGYKVEIIDSTYNLTLRQPIIGQNL